MDIKTVCLGLLTFGEASGYEIKKLFEDGTFNGVYDASFGSIYPALTRLTEEGFVTPREEEQHGRPDKKVYALTPAGRAHFIERLVGGIQPDKVRSEFLMSMIFAHLMPRATARAYLDQYLAECRAALERLDAAESEPDSQIPNIRFSIGLGRARIEATLGFIEKYRHMIDDASDLGETAADREGGVSNA